MMRALHVLDDLAKTVRTSWYFQHVNVAGIGKSTLLNLIAGVLEPTKGQISRNPKVPLSCVCLSADDVGTSLQWCNVVQ